VLSARVSERDQNGLPARASLRVGYDAMGIEENWDSIVNAEEEQGIIEARSADTGESVEEGIFEVLKTKWQLHDLEDIRRQGVGVGAQTTVRLDVEVKFRSAMYDKLFAGVEEKVAGIMVGAFEKRIKELVES
jgi:coenzyme Q-binding protein COQ10